MSGLRPDTSGLGLQKSSPPTSQTSTPTARHLLDGVALMTAPTNSRNNVVGGVAAITNSVFHSLHTTPSVSAAATPSSKGAGYRFPNGDQHQSAHHHNGPQHQHHPSPQQRFLRSLAFGLLLGGLLGVRTNIRGGNGGGGAIPASRDDGVGGSLSNADDGLWGADDLSANIAPPSRGVVVDDTSSPSSLAAKGAVEIADLLYGPVGPLSHQQQPNPKREKSPISAAAGPKRERVKEKSVEIPNGLDPDDDYIPPPLANKEEEERMENGEDIRNEGPIPPSAGSPPKPSAATAGAGGVKPKCITRFLKYVPSTYEARWYHDVSDPIAQRNELCSMSLLHPFNNWTNTYVNDCAGGRLATHFAPTTMRGASRRLPHAELDSEVYSAFHYERICVEGAERYDDTVGGIVEADWEEDYTPTALEGLAAGLMSRDGLAASPCETVCGGRAAGFAFGLAEMTTTAVSPLNSTAGEASAPNHHPTGRMRRPIRVRRTQFKTFIEPLVGLLRDPRVCIDQRTYLLNKGWLAVDPHGTFTEATFPTSRFFYDLGASSWATGAGGASQSWFYHTYRSLGADITEVYAWELRQVKGTTFFRDIPDHLKPIYHYFNYGMTPKWGAWDNPLNHILQRTHRDDFVVLKIDIDSGAIEGALVDEIMANPQLYERIDELYFEHHVHIEVMYVPWSNTTDARHTYVDSLRMFGNLRKRGIRAHSWV